MAVFKLKVKFNDFVTKDYEIFNTNQQKYSNI